MNHMKCQPFSLKQIHMKFQALFSLVNKENQNVVCCRCDKYFQWLNYIFILFVIIITEMLHQIMFEMAKVKMSRKKVNKV